jgi:hypothetical protein
MIVMRIDLGRDKREYVFICIAPALSYETGADHVELILGEEI